MEMCFARILSKVCIVPVNVTVTIWASIESENEYHFWLFNKNYDLSSKTANSLFGMEKSVFCVNVQHLCFICLIDRLCVWQMLSRSAVLGLSMQWVLFAMRIISMIEIGLLGLITVALRQLIEFMAHSIKRWLKNNNYYVYGAMQSHFKRN